jgi:rare lipoprotein A
LAISSPPETYNRTLANEDQEERMTRTHVRGAACSVAALVMAVGAAVASPQPRPDKVAADVAQDQVGLATWYGEAFDGRITAAGDRFDMYGLTAAHSNLPFGSVVEVTNLDNGRKITLRVNDRRTVGSGYVITVTKAAAANLGFISANSATVRVHLVSLGGHDTMTASNGPAWNQAAN